MAASKTKKSLASLLSTTLMWAACAPALAETREQKVCSPSSEHCAREPSRAISLDGSHAYLTNRFDSIARWFDSFFGDIQEDRESASSIVRLKYSYTFAEAGETDDRVRLRGKVDLPQLDKRLKLVFSDEEDGVTELGEVEQLSEDESRSIALQYDAKRSQKLRIENRLGIRSRKFRASSRLRYRQQLSEAWRATYSEEVYWFDTVGFGSRSIIDLDYASDARNLSRWRNQLDYNEESQGMEWLTRLSMSHSFSVDSAITYFAEAAGYTRPDHKTRAYGAGVVYRQQFFKRWLFAEIEPRYFWNYLEEESRREGAASITLRLEAVFSDQHKH